MEQTTIVYRGCVNNHMRSDLFSALYSIGTYMGNPKLMRSKSDANRTQAGRGSDAKARCDWILDYLMENKTIRSSDIINRFDIVKDTAIRDLNNLIRQNKIVKKGGMAFSKNSPITNLSRYQL